MLKRGGGSVPVLMALMMAGVSMAGDYTVTVDGDQFKLNGKGFKVLGLRCSNALVSEAKADELIDHLDTFKGYGINTVSVFFMGSRFGDVKGYRPDATLDPVHAARMGRIIEAADRRGMVVLVGCLYWGTSRAKEDLASWGQEQANRAVANTVRWLSRHDYRNVLVDPDNEGMSPWNPAGMIDAAHDVDRTIPIGNNGGGSGGNQDFNIHFGPKDPKKPYFDSEATGKGYWGTYSKQTHKKTGYNNYSRIGRLTGRQKSAWIREHLEEKAVKHNGVMLASTWLQAGPGEGLGGPFLRPGGRSDIDDVDKDIDTLHPDAGIRWWLEALKDRFGAWVPPKPGRK